MGTVDVPRKGGNPVMSISKISLLCASALLFAGVAAATLDNGAGAQGSDYTQVGTAKVATSLNIHTQKQLDKFLQSAVPKDVTLADNGDVLYVGLHDPLS